MRNIDKLVKFLVTDGDKETLSKSTATDIESVTKFTDYVIDRILPEDFLIQEGSHVEEKDLNSLVRNFNSLLKEENLKPIIIEGMKIAEIKPNQASALMSNLLPIFHEKIKTLMGMSSAGKTEPVKKKEKPAEEEKENKNFFGFDKIEAVYEEPEIQEEVVNEQPVEKEEKTEEESLGVIDKVLMGVIAVCFVAIIGVLVFILVKVNMG